MDNSITTSWLKIRPSCVSFFKFSCAWHLHFFSLFAFGLLMKSPFTALYSSIEYRHHDTLFHISVFVYILCFVCCYLAAKPVGIFRLGLVCLSALPCISSSVGTAPCSCFCLTSRLFENQRCLFEFFLLYINHVHLSWNYLRAPTLLIFYRT